MVSAQVTNSTQTQKGPTGTILIESNNRDREQTMSKRLMAGALTAGLLLLGTQGATAADFSHKQVVCPKDGIALIGTPDGNINITDIILSADAPTDFTIRYVAPGGTAKRVLVRVYLKASETVVIPFSDGVNGEREWSVRATCSQQAKVEVTLTGSGDIE